MYMIDTNIFLELELKQDRFEETKAFLGKLYRGEVRGFLTDFSIDSIVLVMEREGKTPFDIRVFLSSLGIYKGLRIYEISIRDRITATLVMEKDKLDYDDALVFQAMNANSIEMLVSFDKHFDRIKTIKRVEPKDV